MKLDEIHELWAVDSQIDETEMTLENINIPKLHAKYLKILSAERQILRIATNQYNILKLKKTEFYTQGPTGGEPEHWKMPTAGRVLKQQIDLYLDADEDLQKLENKVYFQKQKIDELESIIKTIIYRNQILKNITEWKKFLAGT